MYRMMDYIFIVVRRLQEVRIDFRLVEICVLSFVFVCEITSLETTRGRIAGLRLADNDFQSSKVC